MRPIFAAVAIFALAAAGAAQAGIHTHLPHKHHHRQGDPETVDAPGSDIPEPVLGPARR